MPNTNKLFGILSIFHIMVMPPRLCIRSTKQMPLELRPHAGQNHSIGGLANNWNISFIRVSKESLILKY